MRRCAISRTLLFGVFCQGFDASRRRDGTRSVAHRHTNPSVNRGQRPAAVCALSRKDGADAAIHRVPSISEIQKSEDSGRCFKVVAPSAIRFLQRQGGGANFGNSFAETTYASVGVGARERMGECFRRLIIWRPTAELFALRAREDEFANRIQSFSSRSEHQKCI